MGDENSVLKWLTENREDSYFEVVVDTDRRCSSIFMVPKILKENDAVYTPQVISLGPYHFLKPRLAQMESEKSIIVSRAVMSKLSSDFFKPLQIIRRGYSLPELEEDNFFKRVLNARCRDCYGDAEYVQILNEETFALMMFRDASFLLVFLETYVSKPRWHYNSSESTSTSTSNPFRGLKSGESLYLDVMKDVMKLENQIPLYALESLYASIGVSNYSFKDFIEQICDYYSPFWIQSSNHFRDLPLSVTKDHLLHCLYETVVNCEPSVGFVRSLYNNCWSPLAWLNHCLRKKNINSEPPKGVVRSPHNKGSSPLAWLRKQCVCFQGSKKGQDPSRQYGSSVLPSAVKLSKAGVKFKHYEGGIKHIRFDWKTSTLYLPVMKIGILTETNFRNLIAFELCSSLSDQHPLTSFARLLEELTEGDKDVELLRKRGILVIWVRGDDKVARIVKSLSSSTWKPYFKPVNIAKRSLTNYYSRRTRKVKWKTLWSEFLEAYCSKPWLSISAVAATVLLVMTALQVFCLFYTCNKNA